MKKTSISTKAAVTILLLSILLPFSGLAQSTMISSRHLYNHDLPSSMNIVRSWDQKALITCSRNVASLYSHTFYMRFVNTHAATEVKMPRITSLNGGVLDRIYDMRISGNTCYFCGVRSYIVGFELPETPPGQTANPIPIVDSCGIVGYYSFTRWAEALVPDDSFYVYEIPHVKSAQRMAVYHPESTNVTAMEIICRQDCAGYGPSCLVEMCNSATTPHEWTYNVVTPTDNSEILTDVIVTKSHVVTSSVYESIPEWVIFRQSDNNVEQTFSNINGLGKTQHIYHISDRDPACGADYRLETYSGSKPWLYPKGSSSDGFIAGLSAMIHNENPSGIISNPFLPILFDMANVDQMDEYQVIYGTGSLNLKGLSYLSSPKSVCLMLSYRHLFPLDSVYTYLLFPKLGTYDLCDIYTDTLLRYMGGRMQSIDRFNSSNVCLGGIHWSGNVSFDGTQVQYNRINSCYDVAETLSIRRRHSLVVKEIEEEMKLVEENIEAKRAAPKQTIGASTETTYCKRP